MTTTLFDLDEFEETRTVWEPVWEPDIEDAGWHFDLTVSQLPLRADGSKITRTEWDTYLKQHPCRDCGGAIGALKNTRGCSGSRDGNGFSLCDDCAGLEDCTTRAHERGAGWHVSRWGLSHRVEDHAGLVAAQQRRRSAYLVRVAVES